MEVDVVNHRRYYNDILPERQADGFGSPNSAIAGSGTGRTLLISYLTRGGDH
jgi:hypothetical protein